MARLLTFGCSYTYGQGLIDCYPEEEHSDKAPSKFAWPNELGKLLNLEVVNESKPGSGNLEISNKILKYNFCPDDLVIIMWSHFVRLDHFVVDNKNYEGVRKWQFKNFIVDTSLGFDNAYRNYLVFHHTALYLQSLNIKHYSFLGFRKDKLDYPPPKFLNINNFIDINENYYLDKALDKKHFGIESHKQLAKLVYNKIK